MCDSWWLEIPFFSGAPMHESCIKSPSKKRVACSLIILLRDPCGKKRQSEGIKKETPHLTLPRQKKAERKKVWKIKAFCVWSGFFVVSFQTRGRFFEPNLEAEMIWQINERFSFQRYRLPRCEKIVSHGCVSFQNLYHWRSEICHKYYGTKQYTRTCRDLWSL